MENETINVKVCCKTPHSISKKPGDNISILLHHKPGVIDRENFIYQVAT